MFAAAAVAAVVACYSSIACGPEKERGDQIWEGSVAKVVRLRGVARDVDVARLLRSQALERARKSPLDVGVACREHVLAVRDPTLLQHGAHLDPLDAGVCARGFRDSELPRAGGALAMDLRNGQSDCVIRN